jgi:beta-lactamase class A
MDEADTVQHAAAAGAMTRRAAMIGLVASAPALAWCGTAAQAAPGSGEARLAELEARSGGRIGVAVLDTGTGVRVEHRASERFAMCSTFKLLAAACVLARVDRDQERLDRRIVFTERDIVANSPVTRYRTGGYGMTLAELCEAAMTVSDNTAANLLLASFGGPGELTAYARSLGDEVTRLDRIETEVNEATPGDPRDTTSPAAMLEDMRRLVLGDALSEAGRAQLTAWLVANKTGDKRLRAGLPKDWRVGDKTGAGNNGATNDVAVMWPPERPPILVSAYHAEAPGSRDAHNAVLAEVGRIVAASFT